MNTKIAISDHAILRWLELVEGVDVKAIRKRIRRTAIKADKSRAPKIIQDGVYFRIIYHSDGSATVTSTFSPVIRAHLSIARLGTG